MIFTLILKNERRDSLLYLRVITVFKLLRLVGQALEMGPWTHLEISKGWEELRLRRKISLTLASSVPDFGISGDQAPKRDESAARPSLLLQKGLNLKSGIESRRRPASEPIRGKLCASPVFGVSPGFQLGH